MENNEPQSDQSQKSESKQQDTDEKPVKLKIWQFEWSGPLPPLLALVFGLGFGVVLLYLALFVFQRPAQLYDFLIEDPYQETLSAWQVQNIQPVQTIEVTKEVIKEVTVQVTREVIKEVTVEVTREVPINATVIVPTIIEKTVFVTKLVEVTPTPTPAPETHVLLATSLEEAFNSAGLVIEESAGERQGWPEIALKEVLGNQLNDTWQYYAKDDVLDDIIVIARLFEDVTIVEWIVDLPDNLTSYQRPTAGDEVIFDFPQLTSELRISGDFVCPVTGTEISIEGDDHPIKFVSDVVVIFDQNFIIYQFQHLPTSESVSDQLINYCQTSNSNP